MCGKRRMGGGGGGGGVGGGREGRREGERRANAQMISIQETYTINDLFAVISLTQSTVADI